MAIPQGNHDAQSSFPPYPWDRPSRAYNQGHKAGRLLLHWDRVPPIRVSRYLGSLRLGARAVNGLIQRFRLPVVGPARLQVN